MSQIQKVIDTLPCLGRVARYATWCGTAHLCEVCSVKKALHEQAAALVAKFGDIEADVEADDERDLCECCRGVADLRDDDDVPLCLRCCLSMVAEDRDEAEKRVAELERGRFHIEPMRAKCHWALEKNVCTTPEHRHLATAVLAAIEAWHGTANANVIGLGLVTGGPVP